MEIKISRSSRRCHVTNRDFTHEDEIVSLVRIVEGALQREDYAQTEWDDAFAKDAYSVWNTKYYDPNAVTEDAEEEFSPLRRLFYESIAEESRQALAVAFLAAQLLRRQKVFRQVRESEDSEEGGKLLLYVDRIGNKLIEVRDPNFSYAELETARLQLMDRLMALEAPVVEAQPESEDSAAEAAEVVAQAGPEEDAHTDSDGDDEDDDADDDEDADEDDDDEDDDDDEEEDEDEDEDDDEDDEDEDDEDEDDERAVAVAAQDRGKRKP